MEYKGTSNLLAVVLLSKEEEAPEARALLTVPCNQNNERSEEDLKRRKLSHQAGNQNNNEESEEDLRRRKLNH